MKARGESRGAHNVFGTDFGKAWRGFWKDIRTDPNVGQWAPFAGFLLFFCIGVWSAFTARSHFIFTGKLW